MDKLPEIFMFSIIKGIGKSIGIILVLQLFYNNNNSKKSINKKKVNEIYKQYFENLEKNNKKIYEKYDESNQSEITESECETNESESEINESEIEKIDNEQKNIKKLFDAIN